MSPHPLLLLERAVLVHHCLDAAGFAHAIGGALALGFHVGDPRATADIDLNVTCDPSDPESVYRQLPADVPWSPRDVLDGRASGQVRLFWPVPGSAVPMPLDLFFPQHPFHELVARRSELVPMLDASVPILSATDLMVFKMLFDRRQDWADIEQLVRFGKADVDEAASWVEEILGGPDNRLDRLAAIVAEVAADPSPPDPRPFA